MFFTGARIGSLCEVMPSDIRFDGRGQPHLLFRETKGGRPYKVELEAPEAIQAVVDLLHLLDWKPAKARARRPTLVGVSSSRVWQWQAEASKRAEVYSHPHLLRHTFAQRLAEDPLVSLIQWVELMGHANASQLRRYSRATDAGLRAAQGRLWVTPSSET
jgi:integrase